jgi:alginate O-acetyltransferase complex protein AlgJ
MLRRHRRYWALIAAFLLALPLVVGALASGGEAVSINESRMLASAPSFPASLAEWRNLPRTTDAYLRDHFGLRQAFLRAYTLIMSQGSLFLHSNERVLIGPNGWMFYRGNAMVQQSAGITRRVGQLAEAADLLEQMQIRLVARGGRLLVASPPNPSTIYVSQLPLWAQNRGQRTEYDVFLDDLAVRGIAAVDLRPVLRAAEVKEKVYKMYDAHWTAGGATVAFNAIVEADGHPDWKLDLSSALGPPTPIVGGDLARILGVEADVTESDQPLKLPVGKRESFNSDGFGPYLATSDQSGPTIMIIGDSFTSDLFPPMLLQHTGRVIWLHHQYCHFDWKWIDRFHPDEVWWMPTERFIVCMRP